MNTKDVADFVVTTNFDKLPSNVVAKAKICILDILGSSLAAYDTRSANCVRKVVRRMGGRRESTLIGVGVKVPAPLAAWANSMLACALDTDDGSESPTRHVGHHGAIVVPASLSVAESEGLSGKSFIEAVVIGYEVGIRAAYTVSKYVSGGGPSGSMGCYGATGASAKLLRMNKEETVNALNIVHDHNPWAWDMPSQKGSAQTGAMIKEKIGWAVLTGVGAALLAREGFTGHSSIYDDARTDQTLLGSLGKEYKTLKIYHKAYCCCRLTHPALDGLLELMQRYDLGAEDIIKVVVGSSSTSVKLDSYEPKSIEQAEYSIPFVIGATLVDGKVGPEQMNESRLANKTILHQARKVKLEVEPTIDAVKKASGRDQAIVKIETKEGRRYETRVDHAKGSIENPFTEGELKDKFRSLSTRLLGEQRTEEVIKCIDDLENLSNIRELVELVSYAG